jgi:hypothetical protein
MSSDYDLYDRRELHECASVLFDNNEEVFEFEQDALKGRLKNTLYIIEVIESGYHVPFINTPVCGYFPSNRSAFEHS